MATIVHYKIEFDYVTDTSRALNRPQFYAEVDRIKILFHQLIQNHIAPKGTKTLIGDWKVDEIVEGEDMHQSVEEYMEAHGIRRDGH